MQGSWSAAQFPNLNDANCQITSSVTRRYNCLAWAAGEDVRWWWPDPMGVGYWPPNVTREVSLEAFVEAYRTLGYEPCKNSDLVPNTEKVAIFAKTDAAGSRVPTHAALQLPSGKWTSKMGSLEDISHDTVKGVTGPLYGDAVLFLGRKRATVLG